MHHQSWLHEHGAPQSRSTVEQPRQFKMSGPSEELCEAFRIRWEGSPVLTRWSFLEVTSCRKSAMPLRSGSRKPRPLKKGSTSSRGPWNTTCPAQNPEL